MHLRVLAAASLFLLAYEVYTLTAAMLLPLLDNASALQTDFHYYYEAAGRFAADRHRLYLATDDVIAGFAYPPLAILPFLLLSKLLPLGAALLCFTIASYAALSIAVWLWRSHLQRHDVEFDTESTVAITLVALALGPTYSNAIFGQVNAIVLLSCVAFLTLGPRLPMAAGVLLAAGMWLKIYPVLLIAVGAWNARFWRAIAWSIAAAAVLFVIALPIVPLSSHRAFVAEVLPARIDKTAIHISNQSLVAALERFRYPPSRYLYWTGEQAVTVSAPVRIAGWMAAALGLLFLWQRARKTGGSRAVQSEAALMALVAVAAPLGWSHTYVLALPLVILRLAQLRQMNRVNALITFGCVVALMVPAGRVLAFAAGWPDWLQNLAYSRYLVATLALALPLSGRR
jgi:hypothetical protein